MKRTGFVIIALAVAGSTGARAEFTMITQSDFAADAQVITFETPTSAPPTVPGVTFLDQGAPGPPGWYFSEVTANGILGSENWSNIISSHPESTSYYSELGADFATPVQAIGGFVGKIPNGYHQYASEVEVELFDSSLISLGTAMISLPAALNSPVFFGFTASEPIARVRITGNNTGFFGVDDFTYGPLVSVPEPSAIVSAATGLGLLVGYFWRKRRRAAG